MDIKVLVPTLIAVTQADAETFAAIQAEVLAQESLIKRLLSPSWGDPVYSSFEAERHLFVAAGLHTLREFVERSILEFVARTREHADMAFVEEYSQSWINVTSQHGYQERHNHEREAVGLPISGAFYFRTNGQDGDLSILPVDMQTKLFDPEVIEPVPGRLVLFRSEVFHRVGANRTPSDRISFSFNYLLRRRASSAPA